MKLLLIALLLTLPCLTCAHAEEDMPVAVWGTPAVDANVDEVWASAPACTLGSGSTSATVRMLWDDRALYVLCEVTDPALDASAPESYNQDSVEVFLDERCDRTSWYQSDDMHARVAFTGARSIDSGSASRWYTAARQTDAGYIVECAWEWAVITPENGHVAGFDVQLNICQNGRRAVAPCLHDKTGNAYQNTALFGKLRLEGRPEDALTPAYPLRAAAGHRGRKGPRRLPVRQRGQPRRTAGCRRGHRL